MVGEQNGLSPDAAYSLSRSLLIGFSFGLGIGWRRGLWAGLAAVVIGGILYSLSYAGLNNPDNLLRGLASGALFGVSLTGTFILPYVPAFLIGGVWAAGWAGGLGSYGRHIIFDAIVRQNVPAWPVLPIGFAGVILGMTQRWWRPLVLYPLIEAWNLLLYRAEERRYQRAGALGPSLLRRHSVFWDEDQSLPLHGLDAHLLLVIENQPAEGQTALEYLSVSRQRWAAQKVQIELDARQLADCAGVMAIRQIHRSLAPAILTDQEIGALLTNFSHISQDVDAALNHGSAYNQRQALKGVEERLSAMIRDLTRADAPYAVRFRPTAVRWRQIVADRIQELAQVTQALQEINSPYVIGMPLTEQQEVFVGRTAICEEIEHFLLESHGPPLLLYGQRRMGKTSLLNNLGRMLPSTILPLFVDLQGPAAWSSDHAGFLYALAQAMITSAQRQRGVDLPPLGREDLATDPFVRFDEWLDAIMRTLEDDRFSNVLLALDEFEALDDSLTKGILKEQPILGMLRHLIQHRPRLKVLLAGSHTFEEFSALVQLSDQRPSDPSQLFG